MCPSNTVQGKETNWTSPVPSNPSANQGSKTHDHDNGRDDASSLNRNDTSRRHLFEPVQNPHVLPSGTSSSSLHSLSFPGTTFENTNNHNTSGFLSSPNHQQQQQMMMPAAAVTNTPTSLAGGLQHVQTHELHPLNGSCSTLLNAAVPTTPFVPTTAAAGPVHLTPQVLLPQPATAPNGTHPYLSTTTATTVPVPTPASTNPSMAAHQLLTNAILSNWQQQQQQQSIVSTAPPLGNVVSLPHQVPLTLPNIGALTMGVPTPTTTNATTTNPTTTTATATGISNPLSLTVPLSPNLMLPEPATTTTQAAQPPLTTATTTPLPTVPIVPSTIPQPQALTLQDLPHHPPVYNGINPKYPNLHVLHQEPPIFAVHDFLSPTECDFLISVAQDSFVLAPVVGKGAGEISHSRTSSTCYLAREDLPLLLEKVSLLTGKPVEHCELPQVGRYLPTQQYLQHFDAFDLSNEDGRRFASNGGQRTVTVLMYLNDVKEGGQTSFPTLKLDVQPKRGMALVFFPATVDGLLDKNALHAAKPAVDVKYVSQVWIRQGNYEGFPSKRMFTSAEQAKIVQKSLISAREGMDPAIFQAGP